MKRLSIALIVSCMACSLVCIAQSDVTPLPNAHAHNDYEHDRPLLDALDHGFCSVEADIYAVDGELLVAHDREDCTPERTLRKLYLDPLAERAKANGGRVYPGGPTVVLLIDFKSGPEETYPILREQLQDYKDMLTKFTNESKDEGAVTIVLSGASPREAVAAEEERFVGIDGRIPDLDANPSPFLVPMISSSWTSTFEWYGRKDMPAEIEAKMKDIVSRAHEQGRIVRFWAAPQNDYAWEKMTAAKVDLLNTDHLDRLQKFLLSR